MSDSQRQSVLLSTGDEASLAEYKQVSRLAVLSLALAIVSPLGLFAPLLWTIPFAAVGFSVAALIAIQLRGSVVIGRKAALTALAIACFFGATGPARSISRQASLNRSATEFTNEWLAMLRAGNLERGFELHVNGGPQPRMPIDPSGIVDNLAGQSGSKTAAEEFFDAPPNAELLRLAKAGRWEHVLATSQPPSMGFDYVLHRFMVDDPENTGSGPIQIEITVRWSPHRVVGESQWRVESIDLPAR